MKGFMRLVIIVILLIPAVLNFFFSPNLDGTTRVACLLYIFFCIGLFVWMYQESQRRKRKMAELQEECRKLKIEYGLGEDASDKDLVDHIKKLYGENPGGAAAYRDAMNYFR